MKILFKKTISLTIATLSFQSGVYAKYKPAANIVAMAEQSGNVNQPSPQNQPQPQQIQPQIQVKPIELSTETMPAWLQNAPSSGFDLPGARSIQSVSPQIIPSQNIPFKIEDNNKDNVFQSPRDYYASVDGSAYGPLINNVVFYLGHKEKASLSATIVANMNLTFLGAILVNTFTSTDNNSWIGLNMSQIPTDQNIGGMNIDMRGALYILTASSVWMQNTGNTYTVNIPSLFIKIFSMIDLTQGIGGQNTKISIPKIEAQDSIVNMINQGRGYYVKLGEVLLNGSSLNNRNLGTGNNISIEKLILQDAMQESIDQSGIKTMKLGNQGSINFRNGNQNYAAESIVHIGSLLQNGAMADFSNFGGSIQTTIENYTVNNGTLMLGGIGRLNSFFKVNSDLNFSGDLYILSIKIGTYDFGNNFVNGKINITGPTKIYLLNGSEARAFNATTISQLLPKPIWGKDINSIASDPETALPKEDFYLVRCNGFTGDFKQISVANPGFKTEFRSAAEGHMETPCITVNDHTVTIWH